MSSTYGDNFPRGGAKPRGFPHHTQTEEECHDGHGDGPIILDRIPSNAIPIGRANITTYGYQSQNCQQPYHEYYPQYCPPQQCAPPYPYFFTPSCGSGGQSSFPALVTPLTNLNAVETNHGTQIVFKARVGSNRNVTFEWETFEGVLSVSGISYLTVEQSMGHLPETVKDFPIRIRYRGIPKMSFLRISTDGTRPIRFYLDNSETGEDVTSGDHVVVQGSAVSWIMK